MSGRIEVNEDEHSLNWLLLLVMCGTKCLNPFFRLHEASEVLNEYVMGVWLYNSTAAFSLVSLSPFLCHCHILGNMDWS